MYTTINLLKQNEACTGGFGRMLAFFGPNVKLRDQKIPLHVIALVGGWDDMCWALEEALVIDKEQYTKFFYKHAPAVWKHLMFRHLLVSSRQSTNGEMRKKERKFPFLLQSCKRALLLETTEDILAFIEDYKYLCYDHLLQTRVVKNEVWNSPQAFIDYVLKTVFGQKYPANAFILAAKKCEIVQQVAKPAKKPARGAARRSRDWDEEADDTEEEDDDMSDISIPFLATLSDKFSKEERIAHLLHDSPYDFMNEMTYKMPKVAKIVTKPEGRTLNLSVDSPKQMYYLINTLNKRLHVGE
jgi:hypothetical protein